MVAMLGGPRGSTWAQHGGWKPGFPQHLGDLEVPGSGQEGGQVSPREWRGGPDFHMGPMWRLAQGSAELKDAGGRDYGKTNQGPGPLLQRLT